MVDRPKPLSPTEAYEAVQRILEHRDAIALTSHARQRARERCFTVDDIRRVLLFGTMSATTEWDETFQNWKYTVSGYDYDDVPLAIVIAIEPALGRLTVITGKDS